MFFLKKRTTKRLKNNYKKIRKKNYKKIRKNNYKNLKGWGGRGNLGFPTFLIKIV